MPNWQNEAQTDVNRSREWLDRFLAGNADRQRIYDAMRERYGNQADALYQQLLENPGYTPEEVDRMLMEAERRGLNLNEGDARNNYLTEAEIAQITGNPYSWQEGFASRQGGIDNAFNEGRARLTGVGSQGAESQRGVNTGARERTGGALNELDSRLQTNANDPSLGLSGGYGEGLERLSTGAQAANRGTIEDAETGLRATIDGIEADPNALARIRNVDVAGIQGTAARNAGARTNRIIDEIAKRARADGSNPLLMAYATRALGTDGANEAAKAAVDARIMAEREARGAEATAEDMRMAGAGRRSEAQSRNTLATLQARLENENRGVERTMGARSEAERMRLGAQQQIAGLRENAAQIAGNARLGTEQSNANREAQTESEIANRNLQTEAGLTGNYNDWLMNQQNYLTDAQRQSENTNANRQANVALNRQGVTQGNQQTRFGQGTQTLNTLSGIWGNVADARRQGEGEARQFNAGMFGQTGNWGNQNQQTQVQGFSAGTDASANAQRNGNAAASRPSLWERIGGMAIGGIGAWAGLRNPSSRTSSTPRQSNAMGGVVDSPTPTLIGEYGPEAVVPLDPTRPRVPEASMDTLDKILPTVGEATKTRGLYGSMSYEDLRRQKLREKTLGRAPLGVLG